MQHLKDAEVFQLYHKLTVHYR